MKHAAQLAILLLSILPAIASACPSCKDSIPDSDAIQPANLPGGFNFSIYYMLAGLFVTIALVATVIAKGVRSTNARMANTQARITD